MAKKLFVGNLSYRLTSEQLEELFRQHGAVISARVMTDRMTGRSRGFGFVEMEDADADAAVAALNGMEVEGRKMAVNEARPMEPRTGGGDRGPRRF